MYKNSLQIARSDKQKAIFGTKLWKNSENRARTPSMLQNSVRISPNGGVCLKNETSVSQQARRHSAETPKNFETYGSVYTFFALGTPCGAVGVGWRLVLPARWGWGMGRCRRGGRLTVDRGRETRGNRPTEEGARRITSLPRVLSSSRSQVEEL